MVRHTTVEATEPHQASTVSILGVFVSPKGTVYKESQRPASLGQFYGGLLQDG